MGEGVQVGLLEGGGGVSRGGEVERRNVLANCSRLTFCFALPFSKYDLYSKADKLPIVEDLKDYYQSLIDKYIPGELSW